MFTALRDKLDSKFNPANVADIAINNLRTLYNLIKDPSQFATADLSNASIATNSAGAILQSDGTNTLTSANDDSGHALSDLSVSGAEGAIDLSAGTRDMSLQDVQGDSVSTWDAYNSATNTGGICHVLDSLQKVYPLLGDDRALQEQVRDILTAFKHMGFTPSC